MSCSPTPNSSISKARFNRLYSPRGCFCSCFSLSISLPLLRGLSLQMSVTSVLHKKTTSSRLLFLQEDLPPFSISFLRKFCSIHINKNSDRLQSQAMLAPSYCEPHERSANLLFVADGIDFSKKICLKKGRTWLCVRMPERHGVRDRMTCDTHMYVSDRQDLWIRQAWSVPVLSKQIHYGLSTD